jgi:hypothetical protein
MPDENIEILKKETYLKMLENSVDTKLFNSVFVKYRDSGKVVDILNNGEFSCAFFVSGLLSLNQMLQRPHTTIKTLRAKLGADNKWQEVKINDVEPGDVLFWDFVTFPDGSKNEHVGFALNKEEAVSTDYINHNIYKHHITFGVTEAGQAKRGITGVYRYFF